jgi:minor histocompatibility antigen H13
MCDFLVDVCDVYVCTFSVVFPQDLLENGLDAKNFAMLGLGDIVIPGIFIALLLRFDIRSVHAKLTYYNLLILVNRNFIVKILSCHYFFAFLRRYH